MSSRTRATSLLAAGSAVSGLLAYAFFSVTTHAIGAVAAAPVSVLWAWWSFAGAAVTFPVQHWAVRTVAAAGGDEGQVRATLPRLGLAALALAVASAAVAWLLREPLFSGHAGVFPLLLGLTTLGSVVTGLVRGLLTARGRIAAVGAGLVAENGVRCALAAGLAAAGVGSPAAYGWSLVLGYVAMLAWPSALRPRAGRDGPARREPLLEFLGPASGGQLLAQAVLTGGPVLLALAGGSPAQVTSLFAGLALFRAPYTLSTSLVALLTGRYARWLAQGRDDLVRRAAWQVVAVAAVVLPVAALLGWWLGPEVLRLVFGEGIDLTGWQTLLLAVGSTLALAGLVATTTLLAGGLAVRLAATWLVAITAGALWWLAARPEPLAGVCGWFVVVEAVAAVLLLATATRLRAVR